MSLKNVLRCPVCHGDLSQIEKSYCCENKHSYDIAKQGYVNLLLANQKGSVNAGDSGEMMDNRRIFLETGAYQPLAEAVSTSIKQYCGENALNLVDMGCGEGYYTAYLHKSLPQAEIYGFDISKDAIRDAAKRKSGVFFGVGNAFQIPVHEQSTQAILSIFAPYKAEEFARIAVPEGYLFVVTAHDGHLLQLRQMLYAEVTPYDSNPDEKLLEFFDLVEQKIIHYPIHIEEAAHLQALLKMTPFYWHISAEKQAEVSALSRLDLDVSFALTIYQVKD